MKFSEVLPALEAGKRVRRSSWFDDVFVDQEHGNAEQAGYSPRGLFGLSTLDLLASDWEVVPGESAAVACTCMKTHLELHADIAHLTRELEEARGEATANERIVIQARRLLEDYEGVSPRSEPGTPKGGTDR